MRLLHSLVPALALLVSSSALAQSIFPDRPIRMIVRPSRGPPAIRWMASPRVDSYHGIWFELHEDLIQLAGRTRAEEAQAGRA